MRQLSLQLSLIVIATLVYSCAGSEEFSQTSSYQTKTKDSYLYLLNHTARLDGAEIQAGDKPGDNTGKTIEPADFKNYGQCFYKVSSETRLRLHRQSDLVKALENAEPINSTYMPLPSLQAIIKKNRTLQELYTNEMHWILPSIGALAMFIPVMLVDSFLHEGNGVIIKNSQAEVMDNFAKVDKSTRKQIYEALHLTAKAEHTTDEMMHEMIGFGKKNKFRALRKAIMDSRLSHGVKNIFKKGCVGKKAGVCLVAYLVGFNSLFAVALPLGANEVAHSLARLFHRKTEAETLHNLLDDVETINKAQVTNEKLLNTLEKEIHKGQETQAISQLSCPAPSELHKEVLGR